MADRGNLQGAGGTPGGLGSFFVGLGMTVVGGYLLTSRISVISGSWMLWGYNAFGLSLVPLIAGIGVLFFNGRSALGWFLLVAGLLIVFTGILMNLQIYFHSTSLFDTLVMLVLLAGGVGLVFRSLRAFS